MKPIKSSVSAIRRAVAEVLESRQLMAADLPHVWAELIDAQASEVGADPARVRFHRTGSTAQMLQVTADIGGEAMLLIGNPSGYDQYDPADYQLTGSHSGDVLTFAVGESSVDVVFTPRADLVTEGNEKIWIEVEEDQVSPGRYTFSTDVLTVVLMDRPSLQTITVEVPDSIMSESGDNPAFLIVRRSGDLSQFTALQPVFGGTAKVEFDIETKIRHDFKPGESEIRMFVSPSTDASIEGTETLSIQMTHRSLDVSPPNLAWLEILDGPATTDVVLHPIADAWVDASNPSTNHGTESAMWVRDVHNGGTRKTYLKFDISGVASIETASLEVWANGQLAQGSGPMRIFGIEDAVWQEETLTWTNRPVPLTDEYLHGNGQLEPGLAWFGLLDFVKRQKLLGKTDLTLLVEANDDPWLDTPLGTSATLFSRESEKPPRLVLSSSTWRTGDVKTSHRAVTVNEDGSVTIFADATGLPDAKPYVFKIPGSDPDINYSFGPSSYGLRDIEFHAAPDSDQSSGVARFILSGPNGGARLVTVTESDTGYFAPEGDSNTVIVPVSADGFVENGSTVAGGLAPELKIRNTTTDVGEEESFLHFDLTSLPAATEIGSAKVVLHGGAVTAGAAGTGAMGTGAASPVAVSLHSTQKSDWFWDQHLLKWTNRPASGSTAIDTKAVGATGDYEFDVGTLLRQRKLAGDQMVSIAIKGAVGANQALFSSIESGANAPELIVTKGTAPTIPPPPPPEVVATTVDLRAAADTHIRGGTYAGTNYGTALEVEVRKSTDLAQNRTSWFKFDLSETKAITAAQLRLYGRLNAATTAPITVQLYASADTSWGELAMKQSNAPAMGTTLIGSFAVSGTAGKWYTADVSAYLKAQKAAGKQAVTIVAVASTAATSNVMLSTDERGYGLRPVLRVTHGPTPPPVVPPTVTTVAKINFQPAAAPAVSGYLIDAGQTYAARNGKTYGWSINHADVAVDRNLNTNQLLDTNIGIKAGSKWELAVANGTYNVTIGVGDASIASTNNIWVEGKQLFNYLSLAKNAFSSKTISVPVADGKLSIQIGSSSTGATRLNYLQVTTGTATVPPTTPPVVPPTVPPTVPPVTTPVVRRATNDTFVRGGSFATKTNGAATQLELKTSSAEYTRNVWLKFDLASLANVKTAKLRFFAKLNTGGSINASVYESSNVAWTEGALTYATQPAIGTAVLGSFNVNSTAGKWVELDVSALIKTRLTAGAKSISFVLKATSSGDPTVLISSDEATSNRPELVLT